MKKVGMLLLMVIVLITVAACSSSNGGNTSSSGNGGKTGNVASPGTTDATAEPTHLFYWTDDRHDAEYIQEVIDRFNETNEHNIEVEMVVMTDNFGQSLELSFVSGDAPDVFRLKNATVEEFYHKGYLEPLTNRITDEMAETFGSLYMERVNMFDGEVYSLPNSGTIIRLIYNQDLLQQAGYESPPETLDEMVEIARAITEQGRSNGIYGFALDFRNPKSGFERSLRTIAPLSGFHWTGYDFTTGKYDFSPYEPIIDSYKQMYDDGSMLPGVESLDIDSLRAQFAEGKIGMYLSYSSEPGVYQDQFPTDINWAAAYAPAVDRIGASPLFGGTWLGISKDSEHKDAAWQFLEYMYSDEVLIGYHEGGFGISIVPSIVEQAQASEIYGMEGFLPQGFDGIWPVEPKVAVEGRDYNEEFFAYILQGGDFAEIANVLNERYQRALERAIENGEEAISPDPSFDPAQLRN